MISYVGENGSVFGYTNALGIGKRQPNTIYGIKAKELREKNNLTLEELSKELSVKKEDLEKIENQTKGMTETVCERYMKKFGVEKEYFFDTDLSVYICTSEGNVLKKYNTSEECQKAFDWLLDTFLEKEKEGVTKHDIFIDFRDKRGE